MRVLVRWTLSVVAAALVWFALTAPDRIGDLTPSAFIRLPLEGLVLLLLVLVLPERASRIVAVATGVVLGLVAILKVADMGFFEVLGRPFDSVIDWRYLGSGVGVVNASAGRGAAVAVVVAAALLALGVLVAMPWAVLRLARAASRRRVPVFRATGALCAVWVVLALLGTRTGVEDVPVASTDVATYAYDQVARIPQEIHDQNEFRKAAANDPLRTVAPGRLLTALRGKDVLLVFVESYGRVAVQDSTFAPGVRAVLASGTRRLAAAGFNSRSAFLTSPTFGAVSWLAHSTLQSGLWVDSQQRYDALVTSPRLTLSRAFSRAGWRTVDDIPANTHDWPQGAFYGYDKVYDSRNVGYAGPRFGYPTMPDQYTLDALHRLELARRSRRPVFAEIDLLSSHAPWSRLPTLVDQSTVGDGSVFDGMPEKAASERQIWTSPQRVRAAYGASIEYSLNALVRFVQTYGDNRTVLLVLGDHQPATIVSGDRAGHDVPISVVAHDPAVLRRISGWGWRPGLDPGRGGPVWRMDAFRNRFLAAFGASH